MDDTSKKEDVPDVIHVQRRADTVDPDHPTAKNGIVPIEQEAVEDARHIHLSWRSWVRKLQVVGDKRLRPLQRYTEN